MTEALENSRIFGDGSGCLPSAARAEPAGRGWKCRERKGSWEEGITFSRMGLLNPQMEWVRLSEILHGAL